MCGVELFYSLKNERLDENSTLYSTSFASPHCRRLSVRCFTSLLKDLSALTRLRRLRASLVGIPSCCMRRLTSSRIFFQRHHSTLVGPSLRQRGPHLSSNDRIAGLSQTPTSHSLQTSTTVLAVRQRQSIGGSSSSSSERSEGTRDDVVVILAVVRKAEEGREAGAGGVACGGALGAWETGPSGGGEVS
jgi:hypothetical protein